MLNATGKSKRGIKVFTMQGRAPHLVLVFLLQILLCFAISSYAWAPGSRESRDLSKSLVGTAGLMRRVGVELKGEVVKWGKLSL